MSEIAIEKPTVGSFNFTPAINLPQCPRELEEHWSSLYNPLF